MIDKPTQPRSHPPARLRAPSDALFSPLVAAFALASGALILVVVVISMLFPASVAADAGSGFPPAGPEGSVVVIELRQGDTDDAVLSESDLPYNRDTAGLFADQRNALAETAAKSPVRAGSAMGLTALAIAALAWAAMLLSRAREPSPTPPT